MTFIEAAIEILKQNDNQFMKPRDIWKQISEQKLIKTSGKTPWLSLYTCLLYHSRSEYKKSIYFNVTSDKPLKFNIKDLTTLNTKLEEYPIETQTDNQNLESKTLLYQITSKNLGWKKLSIFNNDNNIEYIIDECEEYTYVIEDKAHATIKIGKTKNDPEQRLAQLRTGNPSLTILHVFPSSQFSESQLHQKFGDFQKDLEWFFYAKGLKNFISEELNRHQSILSAYSKKIELEEKELMMLDII